MHVCVCVCVYLLCVGGCLCVLNLLLRVFSCAFGMFLRVLHFACVCFLSDNCALLVSGVPVVICIGGNFSFQIKTQLAQLSLNSTQEVCLCVCMRCIRVRVCVCPWERAIKGAVWWRDCIKGVREETEWQAAEGAACGGGRGADAGA